MKLKTEEELAIALRDSYEKGFSDGFSDGFKKGKYTVWLDIEKFIQEESVLKPIDFKEEKHD